MKILFVLKLEVNPKVGGVERVTHVLARYFLNAGIQVNFFYFQLRELSFPEYHKNMEVFFSPDISNVNSNGNILFLKNLLINNGIDIIINQGNIGNSITDVIARAAKGTGVKIISVLHSRPFDFTLFWGQYKQTLSNHLSLEKKTVKNILKKRFLILFGYNQYVKSYKKYLKTALVTSDRLVLLSRGYIPLLKKILNVEISPKLIAIANPLSFEHHFTPNEMNDKKNQVLYVGRLEYHAKRLDRLINAWSLIENNVPGWKLIIVGGSVDKVVNENDYQVIEWRRLKAMTESLQLKNIIFAGNKNPEPYYRESKLFCLTSSYEGFPLVLGEAMQCGVVPVAFGSFAAVKDI
ncbi:MAG: glycosyltransferase, partial [Ferruginibacter sp.]